MQRPRPPGKQSCMAQAGRLLVQFHGAARGRPPVAAAACPLGNKSTDPEAGPHTPPARRLLRPAATCPAPPLLRSAQHTGPPFATHRPISCTIVMPRLSACCAAASIAARRSSTLNGGMRSAEGRTAWMHGAAGGLQSLAQAASRCIAQMLQGRPHCTVQPPNCPEARPTCHELHGCIGQQAGGLTAQPPQHGASRRVGCGSAHARQAQGGAVCQPHVRIVPQQPCRGVPGCCSWGGRKALAAARTAASKLSATVVGGWTAGHHQWHKLPLTRINPLSAGHAAAPVALIPAAAHQPLPRPQARCRRRHSRRKLLPAGDA